jgi:NAD(P)-dependent dehydrogenase (short-subunit alcohol dehydrogenase family)
MDLGLAGRVVAVTGGSRGIGRAVVLGLLGEGAAVGACARNRSGLDDVAAQAGAGARLVTQVADVGQPGQVGPFIDTVAQRFGGLDALVVNAGAGTAGDAVDTDWPDYADQFAIKVGAALLTIRAGLPYLRRSSAPRVVLVSSVTAHAPEPNMAAVGVARAGLANLAVSLARDLAGEGICVNRVNCGPVATGPQLARHARQRPDLPLDEWLALEASRRGVPLGRMGTVEEVVPWILMLASPRASYVTGAGFDVSGGLGMRV